MCLHPPSDAGHRPLLCSKIKSSAAPPLAILVQVFPGPGPGEYNVAGNLGSQVSPSLKGRTNLMDPRFTLIPHGSEKMPGPGQYSPKPLDLTHKASIHPPLTSPIKGGPGPGTYNPRPPRDGPKFSLASKLGANPLGMRGSHAGVGCGLWV